MFNRIFFISLLLFVSCKEDCYENAKITVPARVTNLIFDKSYLPTFVGSYYYPYGTDVFVTYPQTAQNKLHKITRQSIGGGLVNYYWNDELPPAFGNVLIGEKITTFFVVFNYEPDQIKSIKCQFSSVKEIKSILEVKVRTDSTGTITGQRTIEQTLYDIPAGQYKVYQFPITYNICGEYDFNLNIDPNGDLTNTNIVDKNYTQKSRFCF